MGNSWLGGSGHDEDSDDKLIDEMAKTHRRGSGGGGGNQRGGNPSGRACLPLAIAGAGGLCALIVLASEALGRLV